MESIQDMSLVGYYHFSSKDKSAIYYVVQCLYNENDITRVNNRAIIINCFVDEDTYRKVSDKQIGDVLQVSVAPNLETGKIRYKLVNY